MKIRIVLVLLAWLLGLAGGPAWAYWGGPDSLSRSHRCADHHRGSAPERRGPAERSPARHGSRDRQPGAGRLWPAGLYDRDHRARLHSSQAGPGLELGHAPARLRRPGSHPHALIPPDPAPGSRASAHALGTALGLLVITLTLAAFLGVLQNGFVNWDDPVNFLNNPAYRGLGLSQLRRRALRRASRGGRGPPPSARVPARAGHADSRS